MPGKSPTQREIDREVQRDAYSQASGVAEQRRVTVVIALNASDFDQWCKDNGKSPRDRNFLMAYSHVAHDCKLGNNITMANSVALGGHIVIEDYAILGGMAAVHQFVRIGAYAIVGGLTGVAMDILPYVTASGSRAQLYGLNLVGLKRRGFSEEAIATLKKAYKTIFRSGLTMEEALRRVQDEFPLSREVGHLVEFIGSSKRGITR